MTTNQTIDGVPRELLAFLEKHVSGTCTRHALPKLEELRALLDATRCDSCDDSGDLIDLTGEWRGYCICPAGVTLRDKPVAQPQGEPVYMVRSPGSCCWEEMRGESLEMCQAQPGEYEVRKLYAEQPAPVAVVMSFDFEHPSSKERRTVALSKQDVFDGMEDYFYDKIGEQICRCESVGETNVVDCSCDEYVHDFEIVKASLTS